MRAGDVKDRGAFSLARIASSKAFLFSAFTTLGTHLVQELHIVDLDDVTHPRPVKSILKQGRKIR